MSITPPTITQLSDLFTPQQIQDIDQADLRPNGYRHPTWFVLHNPKPRAIDHLVHKAIGQIARQAGGDAWLHDLAPRLNDFNDDRNASSSLAEIRAYGGLLEAGFQVAPIPRTSDATPDFTVDAGDGPVTVEVFSKHQDEDQDDLLAAVNTPDGEHPQVIERSETTTDDKAIRTTVAELTPAGRPDPNKSGDSVQANLISRVCSMKKNESQVDPERPCVLIADFTHFGPPPVAQLLDPEQTSPLLRGHHGLCSGGMWYGMYGWKGAPVFEELDVEPKRMGHDGRFRLTNKKSRLSAVLFVFHEDVVLLENPWADKPLPPRARFAFGSYPWFNLPYSIADWQTGTTLAIIEAQRRMIEAFDV
ncbi:hypothetical protein [Burkholderia cepacia]|uniref:hypothetical protein n=1 Tax=Burkholderia cepacia TaxID=292 RepID=UPI003EE121BA